MLYIGYCLHWILDIGYWIKKEVRLRQTSHWGLTWKTLSQFLGLLNLQVTKDFKVLKRQSQAILPLIQEKPEHFSILNLDPEADPSFEPLPEEECREDPLLLSQNQIRGGRPCFLLTLASKAVKKCIPISLVQSVCHYRTTVVCRPVTRGEISAQWTGGAS